MARSARASDSGAREVLLAAVAEREFRDYVVAVARRHGWRVYWTWRSDHSPKGYLDLTLCRPPRLIVAELKTATGKTTADQDAWLADLAQVPHVESYLWRPADWRAIERILEGEPHGHRATD